MKNTQYNPYLWAIRRNSRVLKEIGIEEHDGDVRFYTGSGNMAVSCMRNAFGHNYRNTSFIVDVAMRQIPRSTERISSYAIWYKTLDLRISDKCKKKALSSIRPSRAPSALCRILGCSFCTLWCQSWRSAEPHVAPSSESPTYWHWLILYRRSQSGDRSIHTASTRNDQ